MSHVSCLGLIIFFCGKENKLLNANYLTLSRSATTNEQINSYKVNSNTSYKKGRKNFLGVKSSQRKTF